MFDEKFVFETTLSMLNLVVILKRCAEVNMGAKMETEIRVEYNVTSPFKLMAF